MTTTFQADGTLGRCAVWTGESEAPWSNPTGNLDKIKLHSDLDNAGIVSTRTGTIQAFNFASAKTNLFAHGLSYAPLILGFVTISGRRVPINQSILIQGTSANQNMALSFGSDQAYVFCNRIRLAIGVGVATVNVPYEIYVFDVGVTSGGAFRRPTFYAGISFDAGGETLIGRMSSRRRYLHKISSGRLALPRGKTIDAKIGRIDSTMGVGVRQSINGYVCQRLSTAQAGQPGNAATFTAATNAVDI